jgi:flagellar hook-associated protein 2
LPVSVDQIPFLSPELQRAYQTAMKLEQKPIERLAEKKSNIEQKISLLQDVVGKVDNVRKTLPTIGSPINFRELSLDTSDTKAISGVLDKTVAEPGTHNIEVSQLASHASALSNAFPDKDDTRIGSGFFTFTNASGESKDIYLDNPTLEELSRIINQSGLGIKASVVNDRSDPDNPYRLLMSGEKLGSDNNLEYPDFYLTDGDQEFFVEKQKPATNALVKYEGFDIESPTNEVKDIVRGVTLNLKGLSAPGRPETISIGQDIPKTTTKIKDFVDKMNSVFTFIQSQNKLDEKSNTEKTLGGDYGIRVSEERLRSALTSNFFGDPSKSIRSLGDVGIQFNKNGTLNFDDKKFESALTNHYDDVVSFFTGDGVATGVVPRLNRALDTISGREGAVLSSQEKTFTDEARRVQDDIDAREKRAEAHAQDLKEKLGKVQSAISSMQNQGAYLQQNLGGGGNALTEQLLGG